MQFNLTTGEKNGMIQTAEMLLDLGDGGISGNATLLVQFTNLINRAYDNVAAQLMKYEGDYTWDDSNYTNFPIGTTNLGVVAGSEQSDYTLPPAATPGSTSINSFLRLDKVEIMDAAGKYQMLYPISQMSFQTPLETLFPNPGMPQFYKTIGSSVVLYPAPLAAQVTATAGLKLFFERDKVDFLSTDTTKVPGFPTTYHYLLPLEASETWAAIKKLSQLQIIQQKKTEFYQNLNWDTSNRNKDIRQQITPRRNRTNNYYE